MRKPLDETRSSAFDDDLATWARNRRRGYKHSVISAGFWSVAAWVAIFIMPNFQHRLVGASLFTLMAFVIAILFRLTANRFSRRPHLRG